MIGRLETYLEDLKREKLQDEPKAVRTWFKAETESREQLVEKISMLFFMPLILWRQPSGTDRKW